MSLLCDCDTIKATKKKFTEEMLPQTLQYNTMLVYPLNILATLV